MNRKKLAVVFVTVASLGIFQVTAQAAGGTSKGGEVPVVPGFQAEEDYGNAGGTSKGGDVPVTPGLLPGGGGGGGGTGDVVIIG